MKINLHKIQIEAEIGKMTVMDVSKSVANVVYKMTDDIGVMDLMKKVYYAQGEVDIPDNLIPYLIKVTEQSNLKAFVKVAVLKELKRGQVTETELM